MTHPDAKFEKVSQSDAALYGPRKILLCGFGAQRLLNELSAERRAMGKKRRR